MAFELPEILKKVFPFIFFTDTTGRIIYISELLIELDVVFSSKSTLQDIINACGVDAPNNTTNQYRIYLSVPKLNARIFGYAFDFNLTMWILRPLPASDANLSLLPKNFRKFPQFQDFLERQISLNTNRLAMEDASILNEQLRKNNRLLKTTTQGYKRVLDSVNDIVFETDMQGNWTFLNQAWCRVMGYTIEESLCMPFYNFLHPDDVKKNEELFLPLILKQKSYCSHQIRYVSKSGAIKVIKVYAILLLNDTGEVDGTAGTLQDITESYNQAETLKLISENISDVIYLCRPDGSYEYVTPTSYDVTGYTSDFLVNKLPHVFVHPDDYKKIEADYDQQIRIAAKSSFITSYRYRAASGQYLWMESGVKPLYESNGSLRGFIVIQRNIEKRKLAEKLMHDTLEKQSELAEQKSRMISLVSHEFRNPISAIQISVDLIKIYIEKQGPAAIGSVEKQITAIEEELLRLKSSLESILTVGKIESEGLKLHKEKVDIKLFTQSVINRLKEIGTDKRDIIIAIKVRSRWVLLDKMMIGIVIENMVSNAIKYSPGKPPPHLTINYLKENLFIEVKDFGIGIPAAELEKLYTPFYRASNATCFTGSGMGLFIIKKLIELHKGTVKIESQTDTGTTITVKIPG